VKVWQRRYWPTNTTGIDRGAGGLLVDPGVYPDELGARAAGLGGPPEAAFHTHAHWDHVLWSADLGHGRADVPRYVTAETARFLETCRPALLAELENHAGRWDHHLVARGEPLQDLDTVPWAGPEAVVVQTDAHVPGHGCLHVPELGLLLAGDLVSDVDVPFPFWPAPLRPDAPAPPARTARGLTAYREGLDRIAALRRVDVVVPGHGAPTGRDGFTDRLDADRRYLDRLEAVVGGSHTADDAVRRTRSLDPRLSDPAVRAAHDESVVALFVDLFADRAVDPTVDPAVDRAVDLGPDPAADQPDT
jgi:glyoxylase-like metal-dependent hydrolase (beta-lactamase superfamily II)